MDPAKARTNRRKHRVTFEEAATVYGDALALTYPDPDHSISEQRFITVGISSAGRVLIVAHAERGESFGLSALGKLRIVSENSMKKTAKKRKARNELRQEYDLPSLKGGVRGKYFERYQSGTNLVLLSPDVARHFPNEQSVNSALRELIRAGKRPLRRAH
jgi:uncharacterized DUF497 family protein